DHDQALASRCIHGTRAVQSGIAMAGCRGIAWAVYQDGGDLRTLLYHPPARGCLGRRRPGTWRSNGHPAMVARPCSRCDRLRDFGDWVLFQRDGRERALVRSASRPTRPRRSHESFRPRTAAAMTSTTPNDAPRASSLLILLSIVIAIYIGTASRPALLDDADGCHALAAREILQRNDRTVLHVNGIRWIEKPPLHYWLVAGSYGLFGQSALRTRWPVAPAMGGLRVPVLHFRR